MGPYRVGTNVLKENKSFLPLPGFSILNSFSCSLYFSLTCFFFLIVLDGSFVFSVQHTQYKHPRPHLSFFFSCFLFFLSFVTSYLSIVYLYILSSRHIPLQHTTKASMIRRVSNPQSQQASGRSVTEIGFILCTSYSFEPRTTQSVA